MSTFPMTMRFYFYSSTKDLKIVSDVVQNQVEIDEVIEYIKQTFGVNRVLGLVMKGAKT